MDVFPLVELLTETAARGEAYLEFHRTDDLSLGVYVLEAGADDGQSPHTEDEAYVVLAGAARFTAGAETRNVAAGDTIFVAAGVPHRFHDITVGLRLVVVFGPAEGSRARRVRAPDTRAVDAQSTDPG
jgi:quercetin dioxygenase-like cupin family protein